MGCAAEYEIWHTGSIWNLEWLIEHAQLEPPYFTSLFFGWPGGSWSPPTVEEYAYRRRHLPAGSVATVSIMDPRQIDIVTVAIQAGDHVRVGTEDYPLDRAGQQAERTCSWAGGRRAGARARQVGSRRPRRHVL